MKEMKSRLSLLARPNIGRKLKLENIEIFITVRSIMKMVRLRKSIKNEAGEEEGAGGKGTRVGAKVYGIHRWIQQCSSVVPS